MALTICNQDCFRCAYPDCIFDGITADDIKESNARQRDFRAETDRKYAAQREYYEAKREYYEANREKIAAAQREYREANREKIAAARREYREANREKIDCRQLGIDLRRARKSAGHTQRSLGESVGLSQPEISLYESGSVPFDVTLFFEVLPELRKMAGDEIAY